MTALAHALSVRSDFSIGESLLQVEHIIERAKALGYESVTLMDTMSLHAMVDFTNRAKKAGIKPIIGCRLRVYDDPTWKKPAKASGIADKPNPMVAIKVYVVDDEGIDSLMKLLSKANSREQFYYHARCGWDDVLALQGVAVSTGDFQSLWHHPQADDKFRLLTARFGDACFAELVPINTPLFDTLNDRALKAALGAGALTIVTYPFLYQEDSHAPTLDVLHYICNAYKMSEHTRPKQFVQDFGFKEPKHLLERVKEAHRRNVQHYSPLDPMLHAELWHHGVMNIERLAGLCRWEFTKLPVSLPKMADNEFMELGRRCIKGWGERMSKPVLGHQPAITDIPAYKERLHYELSVLKKMGFSGYFLLVQDLVTWAKSNGIIVGPGRGSVGGSLVAYLLGITDVDPIRFNLLFERFINPERLDLPDADLDFMSTRRLEVVDYLASKYGKDRVAGISNYSTLASASALRDAGRIHGLNNIELSPTKLVPKEHGLSATLTEAAKAVPELDKFRLDHPEVWEHALRLEGCMRSLGQHAAGVVVAGEPLVNRAVVESRNDGTVPVVAWDKRVVEDWGLVKMDVLGLSTLDVLEIARQYIKDRHGVELNYLDIPLEEPDVMAAFSRGDTTGVFQFESSGMKHLLRQLAMGGTLTFDDIAAATALYRPGPMDSGLMDDYIQIKQGTKLPYYEHPNMEPALASSNGVMVYQESVMQISRDIAGYTMAEADKLRKIMGKKLPAEMAEQRDKFVAGCVKTSGMNTIAAGELFDKIEAFAGYGFNKSHAVEYSIISVWTMYLRVRYPAEYFAACLSVVGDDKVPGLVADARACGIEVLPPDVNRSTHRFAILDDRHLLAPFASVKGCSENTARRIVELRGVEPFKDDADFEARLSIVGSKVNVTVRNNLRLVGATASIDPAQKAPRHPDRLRDQMALMPGLVLDAVKAERTTDVTDKFLRAKIIHVVQQYRACGDCDLAGQPHPQVRLKSNVKFMVVFDCPSWQEEKQDKLMEGDGAAFVKEAIKAAGLAPGDGYYTTLVKAKKNDKFLSNEQINGCAKYLERELELIKPAVIVAMGSATIRRFLPGVKGGSAELAGKVVFDSKLDASIVCGLNPQQIPFDPSKLAVLEEVFKRVAEIVS